MDVCVCVCVCVCLCVSVLFFIVSINVINNNVGFTFVVAPAFSKHYRKVGQSFCGLARSFELDDRPGLFRKSVCLPPVLMVIF